MRSRLSAAALALAATALVACSSGTSYEPAARSSSIGAGALRSFFPVDLTLVASGDVDVDIKTQTMIDVNEIYKGQFPKGTWILTVSSGTSDLVTNKGGVMLWSADLAPGEYAGPGTYIIDGAKAPELAQRSGIRSAAYLQIVGEETGDDVLLRYDVLLEPCELIFENQATRGAINCPSLGLDRDNSRTISWQVSWERIVDTEA